jgi:hypothetical protein
MSDVRLPFLGYLLAGFVVLVVGVPFSLWLAYPGSAERQIVTPPQLLSDAPKLQTDDRADLQQYLAAENARLAHLSVNPRKPNTFQIPIGRAMDLIAQRGLPGWPRP